MSRLTLRTACALLVLVAPLSSASESTTLAQAQPDEPRSAGTAAPDSAASAPSAQQAAQPVAEPVAEPVAQPVAQPGAQPIAQPGAQGAQPGADPGGQPGAQGARPGAQPATSTSASKSSDADRTICRRIDVLGSRVRRERVCKTQTEWAAGDLQKREVFRSIDRGSAGGGADGKLGGG